MNRYIPTLAACITMLLTLAPSAAATLPSGVTTAIVQLYVY